MKNKSTQWWLCVGGGVHVRQTSLLVSSTANGTEHDGVGVGEALLIDHAEALHIRSGKVHAHLLQLFFQLVLPLDQPLALFLCSRLFKDSTKPSMASGHQNHRVSFLSLANNWTLHVCHCSFPLCSLHHSASCALHHNAHSPSVACFHKRERDVKKSTGKAT